jgi:hypothetical protein
LQKEQHLLPGLRPVRLDYGFAVEGRDQTACNPGQFWTPIAGQPSKPIDNSFGIKLLRACCRAQWRASDALNDAVRHERAFS